MSFYDLFSNFEKTTATVTKKANVFDSVTGRSVETESTIGTMDGILYEKSSSNFLVASKIRDNKTCMFVVSPDETIDRDSILIINSARYSIVSADNVGIQNKVIQISIEELP